ncbi:MAG TPA: hypothetical protein VIK73_08135 [Limnochordales bacterium]
MAVVAAVAWLGYAWLDAAAAWVAARLGPTEVGRWGELLEAYPGTLLIVRVERLLAAPQAGYVTPLVGEGQSVATGTPLVRIQPEPPGSPAVLVTAPFSGVASFLGDGWEGAYSPAALAAASLPEGFQPRSVPLAPHQPVARGEPVVRLVDQRELLGVFFADGSLPEGLGPGARVELVGPSVVDGVPARVIERVAAGSGQGVRLVLRIDRQPVDWLYRRVEREMRLVVGRYEGVILPASGLTRRRGRPGYWLATPGGPSFVAVEVVKQMGRYVVARGVPDGVRVYRWPRWLEGF